MAVCAGLYFDVASLSAPSEAVKVIFTVDAGLLGGTEAPIPSLTEKIRFIWADSKGRHKQYVDFRALLKKLDDGEEKGTTVRIPVRVESEGYYKFGVEAINGIYGVIGRSETVVSVKKGKEEEVGLDIGLIPYDRTGSKLGRRYFVCEMLLRENAVNRGDGYVTRRWPSSEIQVEGAGINGIGEALLAWEKALGGKISFKEVEEIGATGIRFVEEDAVDARGRPGCGNVEDFESFEYMTVHLAEEGFQSCPPRTAIVMHELGHALGFAGHTHGMKTIMEDSDSVWRDLKSIDAATADVMRLLYSYPPGAKLSAMGCKGF